MPSRDQFTTEEVQRGARRVPMMAKSRMKAGSALAVRAGAWKCRRLTSCGATAQAATTAPGPAPRAPATAAAQPGARHRAAARARTRAAMAAPGTTPAARRRPGRVVGNGGGAVLRRAAFRRCRRLPPQALRRPGTHTRTQPGPRSPTHPHTRAGALPPSPPWLVVQYTTRLAGIDVISLSIYLSIKWRPAWTRCAMDR